MTDDVVDDGAQHPRPLSPRQRDALEALDRFIGEHGFHPTHRELLKLLGLSPASLGATAALLLALEAKGWIAITRTRKAVRDIRILHPVPPAPPPTSEAA